MDRKSYLTVYSYTDPGMVSYLSAGLNPEEVKGQRVEGIAHTRLNHLLICHPLKMELSYYKEYTVDKNEKIKFQTGEVDFVIKKGKSLIPIEVKCHSKISDIDLSIMSRFMNKTKASFGVVLYEGLPVWNRERKALFFPNWLV